MQNYTMRTPTALFKTGTQKELLAHFMEEHLPLLGEFTDTDIDIEEDTATAQLVDGESYFISMEGTCNCFSIIFEFQDIT